ncbi:MAG: hypothetical protein AVDCRST_MAG34-2597 [uncultured Nocardioidaceae bacterium]|uniref:Uncharacterized protein n=1 Tax=uncultured Nocardioidaceae bacterium TaxID=253824 RepID=A0A6J4MKM8_9ACTN|nr:MAG: hypothetical protein AVDCRST_MAG34-2597 [uncultured Nocardioidaceae bacterium]
MTGREPHGVRPAPRLDPSARRRRRDEVFGEVLPEATADDREPGRPEDAATGDGSDTAADAWLRDNVPPHHG